MVLVVYTYKHWNTTQFQIQTKIYFTISPPHIVSGIWLGFTSRGPFYPAMEHFLLQNCTSASVGSWSYRPCSDCCCPWQWRCHEDCGLSSMLQGPGCLVSHHVQSGHYSLLGNASSSSCAGYSKSWLWVGLLMASGSSWRLRSGICC